MIWSRLVWNGLNAFSSLDRARVDLHAQFSLWVWSLNHAILMYKLLVWCKLHAIIMSKHILKQHLWTGVHGFIDGRLIIDHRLMIMFTGCQWLSIPLGLHWGTGDDLSKSRGRLRKVCLKIFPTPSEVTGSNCKQIVKFYTSWIMVLYDYLCHIPRPNGTFESTAADRDYILVHGWLQNITQISIASARLLHVILH